MKLTKKFVSAALALTMILSLMTPAMAESKSKQVEIIDSNEIVIASEDGSTLILKGEDFENGDACVSLIQNNEVIFTSYIDRENSLIINEDLIAHTVETQVFEPLTTQVIPKASTNYTNVGKITYNYYIQGVVAGQRSLQVSYRGNLDPYATYNIIGKYVNVATVASAVAGFFGIGVAKAMTVALTAYQLAGYTSDAVNVNLPLIEVDATKHTMEWRGIRSASDTKKSIVWGAKYDFNLSRNGKIKSVREYEGSYYTLASFNNHENSLASELYIGMWGNDTFDVLSWSKSN